MQQDTLSCELDGVQVRTVRGQVFWMSEWERCDELANRGLLIRVNHGPATYGHCSYHLPGSVLPVVVKRNG